MGCVSLFELENESASIKGTRKNNPLEEKKKYIFFFYSWQHCKRMWAESASLPV